MQDYTIKDWPWSFYFNGELMPRWSACWAMAGVGPEFMDDDEATYPASWIGTRIDHVGVVESSDPDVFLCAIQQVLYCLLERKAGAMEKLTDYLINYPLQNEIVSADEVYAGLVEGSIQMRRSILLHSTAFWSSGYSADRDYLLERMRRAALPSDSPEHLDPPHVVQFKSLSRSTQESQLKKLHVLAQSGRLDREMRKKLFELRLDRP